MNTDTTELGFTVEKHNPLKGTPRPTKEAIWPLAAKQIAAQIAKWDNENHSSVEDCIPDVLALLKSHDRDGYDLAKRLEHAGYTPDSQLVEILDQLASTERHLHDQLLIQWVIANPLTTYWNKDDRVTFTQKRFGKPIQKTGTIINVDAPRQCYTISSDQDQHKPNQGFIINHEDVVGLATPTPASAPCPTEPCSCA